MQKLAYRFAAIAVIAFSSLAAKADTISTFSLSNFTFNTGGTATGTVAIDTTTGVATGVDVTFTLGSTVDHFTGVDSQAFNVIAYIVSSLDVAGDDLVLALPVTSLVGYAGGVVCAIDNPCNPGGGGYGNIQGPGGVPPFYVFESGALTFESSETTGGPTGVTPEPSTIALLATGLIGTCGAIRRRIRI